MSARAHRTSQDFRRRRLALALAVGALAAFGLVLLGSSVLGGGGEGERADSRSATPAAAAGPFSPGQTAPGAARSPIGKEIGQKIMSRMDGTTPGSGLLRRVRAGRVGGVILFADNVRSLGQVRAAVQRLQRAAEEGGNPPLLIAVDQEGGIVKRFTTLPPATSPRTMAARRTARREGARTGAALRDVGVNLDLAPVADVPQVRGSFLGSRAFGRSAGGVARSACAFADGLRDGGVLPTLKHFPGLGAAGANTDFADVTITASAASIRAAYEPYRRCASRGVVMVANARYPKLTGSRPAVLARSTYTRELARAGFDGVTISDDLQADGIDPIPELAVKSAAAGLDIALYAKTELAAARAFAQIERAVRSGRLKEGQIRAQAAKIRALKERIANRPASAPAALQTEPAALPTEPATLAGRTIVLDPGHNGGNRSARARIGREVNAGGGVRKACDTTGTQTSDGRLTESRLNLDVARRLKTVLEERGATVVMTRTNDAGVGPCITQRAKIGNDADADVAVSIHADGGPQGGRGFHVIYPKPIRGRSAEIVAPSRALALALRTALRSAKIRAANYIGRRGLSQRGDLGGLNLSKVPKVFVEMGNMRNARDAAQLRRAAHRRTLAGAIADGIGDHLAGRRSQRG